MYQIEVSIQKRKTRFRSDAHAFFQKIQFVKNAGVGFIHGISFFQDLQRAVCISFVRIECEFGLAFSVEHVLNFGTDHGSTAVRILTECEVHRIIRGRTMVLLP